MESKIDIVKFIDQIISQNYIDFEKRSYTISTLEGNDLIVYNNFNDLVFNKLGENKQIFVSNSQIVRFAVIYDFEIDQVGFKEVLYDDLTSEEKLIFDNFYNTFTSWQ
jgi:hypothetical protein